MSFSDGVARLGLNIEQHGIIAKATSLGDEPCHIHLVGPAGPEHDARPQQLVGKINGVNAKRGGNGNRCFRPLC